MSEASGEVAYAEEGGYERLRTRYTGYVETWANSRRAVIWSTLFILAAGLVFLGTVIPGGNYVSTIFGIAAGVLVALVLLGIKHVREVKKDTATLRERLSPRKRVRIGLIAVILTFIVVGFASADIPYAGGGAVLLVSLIMVGDFLRLTPEERYRQREDIPDPRDYAEETVYVEPEEVAADFAWEDDLNASELSQGESVGEYPPPRLKE